MFDPEKEARIRTMEAEDVANSLDSYGLGGLSKSELRALYKEVGEMLGETPASVGEMNLEAELVEQYIKTKDLVDDVLADSETPANQRAMVCNSVVSTLGQLVKLQEDLQREETLKIMESCLVEAIKTLPEDVKSEFFREYERLATKAGLKV